MTGCSREWLFVLLLLGVLVATDAWADSADSDGAEKVEELICSARTMDRFAQVVEGSVMELRYGLSYLNEAEQVLNAPVQDAERSDREREILTLIQSLREDIQFEIKQHTATLHGAFPLVRFVKNALLSQSELDSKYQLLADPSFCAAEDATEKLVERLAKAMAGKPVDIIVVSGPGQEELEVKRQEELEVKRELEIKLCQILGRPATFTARAGHRLNDEQRKIVYAVARSSKAPASVFGDHPLVVVKIRQDEAVDGYLEYVAEAYQFADANSGAELLIEESAFSVDRRSVWVPILLVHGVLWLTAIFGYRELVRRTSHTRRAPPWSKTLAIGGLGFLWGRLVIWGLAPVIFRLEPSGTSSVWVTLWWPAALGLALILGPASVLWFAEHRIKVLGSAFGMYNRGGAIFAAISLGSVAFLVQNALHYFGWSAWILIPPLVIGVPVAAFVVGRGVDHTDAVPRTLGLMCAVATALLGMAWWQGMGMAWWQDLDMAWCHGATVSLWLAMVPVAVIFAISLRSGRQKRLPAEQAEQSSTVPEAEDSASPCEQLMKKAYVPPFHETSSFAEAQRVLQPWTEGRTVLVGLFGPAGSGKSATLAAMQRAAIQRVPGAIVLRGTCPVFPEGATAEPYIPFTEAIAGHFDVNLLAPPSGEMKQIDAALGGLFDSVVPFSKLLFPPSSGDQSGSKKEMFVAIGAMLRRLASQQPVILVLDDLHWIDPASKELLAFLLEEFPPADECPLVIVLAGRKMSDVAITESQIQLVPIKPLTRKDMQAILISGLGFHRDTATDLLNVVAEQADNLFWLFQMVVHLAQKNLFVWRAGGFDWSDEVGELNDHLPDDYRQSLELKLAEHPEFRSVLQCAACVGIEFNANELGEGVDLSRLELLDLLHRIEKETGIVHDVLNKDDTFAFRSTFMLEVLRKILDVKAVGPRIATAPQIIREYHHRLARALETTLDESNKNLYAVANHYYAAGATHAHKALEYSLRAAKSASAQFQHDAARKYIAMARECAGVAWERDIDLDMELLLIECHEAHVEGKNRVQQAEAALEFLSGRPDADFQVCRAVALACYDAGIDTRDQHHFADCVQVAQGMLDRFRQPVEQAEAHQFWGIGLPIGQVQDRREHLEAALELVKDADEDDLEAISLKARIANSLAELLSYGNDEDKSRARELFELSIQLKSREDIRDLNGLAAAHGGLGRLYFFGDDPDLALARKHFEEDLRYSERIGSLAGQTKMHSLLAACAINESLQNHEKDFDRALEHYQASYKVAEEEFDTFFALAGLVECHESLGQHDQAAQHGQLLVDLIQSRMTGLSAEERKTNPLAAVPNHCLDSIRKALRQCEICRKSTWHQWLSELIDHNRVSSTGG